MPRNDASISSPDSVTRRLSLPKIETRLFASPEEGPKNYPTPPIRSAIEKGHKVVEPFTPGLPTKRSLIRISFSHSPSLSRPATEGA